MLPDDERDDRFEMPETAAPPIPVVTTRAGEQDSGYSASAAERNWRQELPRWLATLNPGRTQREYEKAVRYFFEISGVPAALADLTFDLLLAYRGSLALRAMPHRDQPPATARATMRRSALQGKTPEALPGEPSNSNGEAGSDAQEHQEHMAAPTALSPATVNLRLTALRQFLIHCALFGWLPDLSPDRIRAALRRLNTERRRPYSVLAEPEWAQFLEAARLPARGQSAGGESAGGESAGGESAGGESAGGESAARSMRQGPWGIPRAARKAAAEGEPAVRQPPAQVERGKDVPLVHSRAGLTGTHTAQRDHALLALALATGLRAIELASLDLSDLSREWHAGREEWWLVLPDAKTKGQHGGRTLPLASELVESLLAYVASTGRSWDRADDHQTPLFLSRRTIEDVSGAPGSDTVGKRRSGRLSAEHIRRIVDRVEAQWLALRGLHKGDGPGSLAADTRAISPHALRHSTAIALLEGNTAAGRPPASVEHVRGWLGHFDIRTTQGYLAHLESRKHRRPFTLAPLSNAADEAGGTRPDTGNQDESGDESGDAATSPEPYE